MVREAILDIEQGGNILKRVFNCGLIPWLICIIYRTKPESCHIWDIIYKETVISKHNNLIFSFETLKCVNCGRYEFLLFKKYSFEENES